MQKTLSVYVRPTVINGRMVYQVRDRRSPGDAVLSTHLRLSDARRERVRVDREIKTVSATSSSA